MRATKRLKNRDDATKQLNEQTDLIEKLSKDNLALCAKLGAITGKFPPESTFSA